MGVFNDTIVYAVEMGYKVFDDKIYGPKGSPLKLKLDKKGYPRFSVKTNKKIRNIHVHRFVAYLKYGNKVFEPGLHVRHLNNNSLDFSYENISLGTPKENNMDKTLESRLKSAKIAASFCRKFTDGEACEIRKINKHGIGTRRLSRVYKVSRSTLFNIINNKTYKINTAEG